MFTLRYDGQTRAALTRLIGTLTRAQAALHDRSKPLERIKKRQIKRWQENFLEEGGIYEEWPPLAAYYVDEEGDQHLGWTGRDRQAMGHDPEHPILQRTGGTFANFVAQNQRGDVSNTAIDWNFRNEGGSRGDAFVVSHHTGYTTALGTVVPARVLWDLDEEDEDAAEEMLERYVDQVIARYF